LRELVVGVGAWGVGGDGGGRGFRIKTGTGVGWVALPGGCGEAASGIRQTGRCGVEWDRLACGHSLSWRTSTPGMRGAPGGRWPGGRLSAWGCARMLAPPSFRATVYRRRRPAGDGLAARKRARFVLPLSPAPSARERRPGFRISQQPPSLNRRLTPRRPHGDPPQGRPLAGELGA